MAAFMNPTKTKRVKRFILGVFILISGGSTKGLAEGTPQCPAIRFENTQSVSAKDIGRMAIPPAILEGATGVIEVFGFDDEDYPVEGSWKGAAFLLARTGDLGETPVAGYIWSKGTIHLDQESHHQARSPAIARFVAGHRAGCEPFLVSIQAGGSVVANGKRVGVIK